MILQLETKASARRVRVTCTTALCGVRNLAFIGGGTHIIDQSLGLADISVGSQIFPGWKQFYIDGFKHALEGPFLLALDIETGVDAFKYVWPGIYNISKSLFPAQYHGGHEFQSSGTNCAYTIPYAMSDPVAMDLWNVGTWANNSRAGAQTGEDGYVDSIYVGDMNGVFYGIKLNFDPLQTLSSSGQHYGIYVDLWRTKPIPVNSTTTQDLSADLYRSWRQPITTQPAASWEPNMTNLRVVTGAGKYGTYNQIPETLRMLRISPKCPCTTSGTRSTSLRLQSGLAGPPGR